MKIQRGWVAVETHWLRCKTRERGWQKKNARQLEKKRVKGKKREGMECH